MRIKMTNEAKTGILVMICVAALLGMILKVGNFKLLQEGYTIKSHLHYTAGVKKHAPVRLSGVDVGEVKEINILYGGDTTVELVLWIQEGVKIRRDSLAYVTTLGLMGEKYIEIKAGTEEAEYAMEGDIIPAEEPVRLEDILKMATEIGQDIGSMAQDISKVAQSVDRTIDDNRPRIDSIFENLEETSVNFNDFSQDVKYHPWKVLFKGKEKSREEMDRLDAQERARELRQKADQLEMNVGIQTQAVPAQTASKYNFSPRN